MKSPVMEILTNLVNETEKLVNDPSYRNSLSPAELAELDAQWDDIKRQEKLAIDAENDAIKAKLQAKNPGAEIGKVSGGPNGAFIDPIVEEKLGVTNAFVNDGLALCKKHYPTDVVQAMIALLGLFVLITMTQAKNGEAFTDIILGGSTHLRRLANIMEIKVNR